MIKVGTPVIYRGKNCIVKSKSYTARFLDSQDYEMINHGMGHLAGTYGTAYDLYCIDDGKDYKKCKASSILRKS